MTNIISKLIQGIGRFSVRQCASGSSYNKMVEEGQSPQVMVIGCSDSLVDPLSLMEAQEGELFVHRNIAALVPPYQHKDRNNYHATSAALEYGVKNLNVKHIIVLGHGNCGGITALLNDSPKQNKGESFIKSWVQIAALAKDRVMREHSDLSFLEKRHLCEKESILISLQNLRTFPWIEERETKEDLYLHGWHFDRGKLSIYNEKKKIFELIDYTDPH